MSTKFGNQKIVLEFTSTLSVLFPATEDWCKYSLQLIDNSGFLTMDGISFDCKWNFALHSSFYLCETFTVHNISTIPIQSVVSPELIVKDLFSLLVLQIFCSWWLWWFFFYLSPFGFLTVKCVDRVVFFWSRKTKPISYQSDDLPNLKL